jgi:hypothetical protein
MMSRRRPTYDYDRGMRIIGSLFILGLVACGGDGSGGGDEFCDGGDCVCPATEDCIIDCPAGVDCDVQVLTGATVDVACGDALTCDVECSSADTCDVDCAGGDCDVTCPAADCKVTNCPEASCEVLCGLSGVGTRTGDVVTCP